jgi:DNA polymerase-3 subunit gamma/tau
VCRELSRIVRDVLVLSVDPSRIDDPEIAGEGERDRLKALAGRFSREDLLRAFDLLTRAEQDIKSAAQPRYHLEMALLRWIHLRKLVSIEDLIAGAGSPLPARPPAARGAEQAPPLRQAAPPLRTAPPASVGRSAPSAPAPPSLAAQAARAAANVAAVPEPKAAVPEPTNVGAQLARPSTPPASGNFKDALVAEIKKTKAVFYNMVVAQARIEVAGDRVTFGFTPAQRALKDKFEAEKAWLESVALGLAGRRIAFASAQADASAAPPAAAEPTAAAAAKPEKQSAEKKSALREQALADAGVQTMLEVFPAEIRDVEEM